MLLINAGDKIGALLVIARVPTPKGKNGKRGPYYQCECTRCGNVNYITTSGDLLSGRISSCGCYRNSQEFADSKIKHGHRRQNKGITSQAYESWLEMKKRCDNPKAANYRWYGARGIRYEYDWKKFENFLRDMGETEEGMTLDRIDHDQGYYKENCRWVTKSFNSRNGRRGG